MGLAGTPGVSFYMDDVMCVELPTKAAHDTQGCF